MTGDSATVRVSVLDLVPVRTGQSSADAVAASIALAQVAEDVGATRYWFAEHHNMRAVASTSPPVLAAAVASVTRRLRVGSGGVMLPNHTPFVVAEQFAALEAIAPGRIDLGLGRSPGSDPAVGEILRNGRASEDSYPEDIESILDLLSARELAVRHRDGRLHSVAVTPAAATVPEVWLLGSSDYSALLAARLGLPYVFASHFSIAGIERALDIYRSQFRSREGREDPITVITANVSVSDSRREAVELALPQARAYARLHLGQSLGALETVEDALEAARDQRVDRLADEAIDSWIVDTPELAGDHLLKLASRFGADEVMISPVASASRNDPLDRYPARESSVQSLAARLIADTRDDEGAVT